MFVYSKIGKLLEERGYSKVSLQRFSGMSKAGLYNIMTGVSSPTADNLEKIADFFSVSIDYFFERNYDHPDHKVSLNKPDTKENNLNYSCMLEELKRNSLSLEKLLSSSVEKEVTEKLLLSKEETLGAKEQVIETLKSNIEILKNTIKDKEEIIRLIKNEN